MASGSNVFCSCNSSFTGDRCEQAITTATDSTSDDLYYLLGVLGLVALISLPVYFAVFRKRRHDMPFTYWWTGFVRLSLLFVGLFDTISDAFFIVVVSQTSGSSTFLGAAIAFTVIPYVINLVIALAIGLHRAMSSTDSIDQGSWFGLVVFTFLTGDVSQSSVLAHALYILHLGPSKCVDVHHSYGRAFGMHALRAIVGLFVVQFCFKDLPHLIIQATFLSTLNLVNPIVVLALAATVLTTAISVFSFLFFTLIPVLQSPPEREADFKNESIDMTVSMRR